MIKTSFSLKRPDSVTETSVILRCQVSDGRLTYYTNISVLPGKWASPSQGITAQKAKINKVISDYEDKCGVAGIEVTRAGLREVLEAVGGKKNNLPETAKVKFFPRLLAIICDMGIGIVLTPGKKKYSPVTVRNFKVTIPVLEAFKLNMKLEDANMTTYNEFITYGYEKGWSTNYMGTIIKNWKSLCAHCGFEVPRGFKRLAEEGDAIALSDEDLKKMYECDLSDREKLVIDWLKIGVNCGARVGDLFNFTELNYDRRRVKINGTMVVKGFINYVSQKTHTLCEIPSSSIVEEVRKKYNGWPTRITDVEFNRVIKVIAKKAELTQKANRAITKGGERVLLPLQRWQRISSHTMRRTFITAGFEGQEQQVNIKKMVGISSDKHINLYNKMTPATNANIMAASPRFQ